MTTGTGRTFGVLGVFLALLLAAGVYAPVATEDSYCRPDDVIQPGGSCDVYSTSTKFDVSSTGQGCLRTGSSTSCAGSGISVRSSNLTFVAARNDNNSWTIEEVSPEPPD